MLARKRILFGLAAAVLSVAIGGASAQDWGDQYYELARVVVEDLTNVICLIKDATVQVVGVLAVTVIVISGANYVFHAESPRDRQASKERILYALVGLMIVLIATAFIEGPPLNIKDYCPPAPPG